MALARLLPEWFGADLVDGLIVVEFPLDPLHPEWTAPYKPYKIKLTDWIGVDNVVKVADLSALPGTGDTEKLYITIDNNNVYTWNPGTLAYGLLSAYDLDAIHLTQPNEFLSIPEKTTIEDDDIFILEDSYSFPFPGAKAYISGANLKAAMPSGEKEVINCYIVGSTPLASDWLSLTVGGAALTPSTEKIYIILTAGSYANTQYRWDGSAYVSVGVGGELTKDAEITGDFDYSIGTDTDKIKNFKVSASEEANISSEDTLSIYSEADMQIFANNSASLWIKNEDAKLVFSGGEIILKDGNEVGAKYAADYSDNFEEESLVTKRYVDSKNSVLLTYFQTLFSAKLKPRRAAGSADALVVSDNTGIVEMNSSSAFNFTINQMSDGFQCDLININTGVVTLVAGSGVTLRYENASRKLSTQYKGVSIYFRSATECVIVGPLTA